MDKTAERDREFDLVVEAFEDVAGEATRVRIGVVLSAPPGDASTLGVLVGGELHDALVLNAGIEYEKGNRVFLEREGGAGGRWKVVGFAWGDDPTAGIIGDPSTESPFTPPDRNPPGTSPGAGTEPDKPGTEILDRRPGNTYADPLTGVVLNPTDPRPRPTRPPGTSGPSPIPPPRFPPGYAPPGQPPESITFGSDIRQISAIQNAAGFGTLSSRSNHEHAHGSLPVTIWTTGEPHSGYAKTGHTHTPDAPGDVQIRLFSYREKITVPLNNTTKIFSTRYKYRAVSLLVFLNGVAQMFPDEVTEHPDRNKFTFDAAVVVDGTGTAPDTVLAYYDVDVAENQPELGWGVAKWGTARWGSP